MKILTLLFLVALADQGASSLEVDDAPHSTAGEICIKTDEPSTCMKGYGFICSRFRLPQRSMEAHILSCNAGLSDGRMYFVQLLYDDGGWAIELQKIYMPEPVVEDTVGEDPDSILETYMREEMTNYNIHSSGLRPKYLSVPIHAETGTRRSGEQLIMRAVCGVIVGTEADETFLMGVNFECTQNLLRAIMKFSQSQSDGPYRAAGESEIEWQSATVTLVSNDLAFIVDGRYVFPQDHRSCRRMSNCCSEDGSTYLDSCREPTEPELNAIKSCLGRGSRGRSAEYFECLRAHDVKVGCEDQADGSRICY